MKLQKISTLLVFSMFAMVAKSQSFWTDTNMEVSKSFIGNPSIVGIEKDPAGFVKVYTYEKVFGYFEKEKKEEASSEPKKKGFAALKEAAKEQSLRKDFELKEPGLGIFNTTQIEGSGSKITSQIVCPTSLDPNEKYKFFETKSGLSSDYEKELKNPIGVNTLGKNYPFLHLLDTPTKLGYIRSTGDGFLQNKNPKAYILSSTYGNRIDSFSALLKSGSYSKDFATAGSESTILGYAYHGGSIHSGNINVETLWNIGAAESWDMYRNYKIVYYTDDGKIIKATDKKYDFLRDVKSVLPVYDDKRVFQGAFITFGPQLVLGKKSLKDPIENRVNVAFFDTEGNEKFAYAIEYGDKGNTRAFTPEYVVLRDNKIIIYNRNSNKILKPINEILTLDDKAIIDIKVNTESSPSRLYPGSFVDLGNNKTISATPIDNDAYSSIPTVKCQGIELNMYDWNGYKSVCYLAVKAVGFNNIEAIDYVGEFDGKHIVVISTDVNNFVASLGNDGTSKIINVCNIEKKNNYAKTAAPMDNIKNFYVNKETKIIYFGYMATNKVALIRGIAY